MGAKGFDGDEGAQAHSPDPGSIPGASTGTKPALTGRQAGTLRQAGV